MPIILADGFTVGVFGFGDMTNQYRIMDNENGLRVAIPFFELEPGEIGREAKREDVKGSAKLILCFLNVESFQQVMANLGDALDAFVEATDDAKHADLPIIEVPEPAKEQDFADLPILDVNEFLADSTAVALPPREAAALRDSLPVSFGGTLHAMPQEEGS